VYLKLGHSQHTCLLQSIIPHVYFCGSFRAQDLCIHFCNFALYRDNQLRIPRGPKPSLYSLGTVKRRETHPVCSLQSCVGDMSLSQPLKALNYLSQQMTMWSNTWVNIMQTWFKSSPGFLIEPKSSHFTLMPVLFPRENRSLLNMWFSVDSITIPKHQL
jgi:hypothetical protein